MMEPGSELHFPMLPGEGPDAYRQKLTELFNLHKDSPVFKAILDLMDARERELWSLYVSEARPQPERLLELHSRMTEVRFLTMLLEGKASELERVSRESERKEAERRLPRQRRLARSVDNAVAGPRRKE